MPLTLLTRMDHTASCNIHLHGLTTNLHSMISMRTPDAFPPELN
jgi:hypothetical protein